MSPEDAQLLFRYNQWANRRVLDVCAGLTTGQFVQNVGSSFGSARDTLAHIYGAEWIWNERLQGRSLPALPAASDFPDLAVLRSKLEQQDAQLLEYTARLTAADLDRVFSYSNSTGKEFSNPLWQILQHMANHGTYHRGQIATIMRLLGGKSRSTDFIAFFRELNAPVGA